MVTSPEGAEKPEFLSYVRFLGFLQSAFSTWRHRDSEDSKIASLIFYGFLINFDFPEKKKPVPQTGQASREFKVVCD